MTSVNKIKTSIIASSAGVALLAQRVLADSGDQAQQGVTEVQSNANIGNTSLTVYIGNIINTLLLVIGIAAVIMLIIGGFRYVFSQGNEKAVSGAKDTILYSIIGIVVAILAFSIVQFVLGQLK
jgi:hypothetical protein